MKTKKFFEQLNNELDNSVPKLTDELLNAPITIKQASVDQAVQDTTNKNTNFFSFFTPKKLAAFASAFVICFLAVFGIIRFAGSASISDSVILQVDINPSFTLILDNDMRVERVVSNNSDADVIIKSEGFMDSIIGSESATAVSLIAQEAERMGYIDREKTGENGEYNLITVSASGNKNKLPKNLLKDISTTVTEYFKQSGVYVFVDCVREVKENFEESINQIQQQTQLYYESLKADITSFVEYTKSLIFEYCNNLLVYSLNKYDLYVEINELNEIIEEENSLGYWFDFDSNENTENEQKMANLLEELYVVYGDDLRERSAGSYATFSLMMSGYKSVDISGLKELSVQGIDGTLFDFGNELLSDFILISAEEFIENAIDFYSELITSGIEDLAKTVDSLIEHIITARAGAYNNYGATSISDSDYQNFLELIGK